MKKAIVETNDFNRLIAATKAFISKSDQRLTYQHIRLDFSAKSATVTAAACDGYRLSVERAPAYDVEEDFTVYVRPCMKLPAKSVVVIELSDKDAILRCNGNIMGCEQPDGEFLDYEKFFEKKPNAHRYGFNARFLLDAVAAARDSLGSKLSASNPIILEFTGPQDPAFIFTDNGKNMKMVLPVRINDAP